MAGKFKSSRRKYNKKSLKKEIKSVVTNFLQPEIKMLDGGVTTEHLNTGGSKILLNPLILGTSYSTRTGMEIKMLDIDLIIALWSTPTTGLSSFNSIMLVDFLIPHATQPSVFDVMAFWNDHTMQDNYKNFRILKRWFVTLSESNQGADGEKKIIHYRRKLNLNVKYNTGNTGNINDIEKHALYLMYFGSEASGVTDGNIATRYRIRYYDI